MKLPTFVRPLERSAMNLAKRGNKTVRRKNKQELALEKEVFTDKRNTKQGNRWNYD